MVDSIRWLLVATGRVQGVNYRARVADCADRYGILGTVENRDDGTVFIDAQGRPDRLKEFVRDVSGPWGASHPRSVERVGEGPAIPSRVRFEILRH